ncbi:MAG: sensor histidine kinase [Eubacteriales bacterium]
MNLLEILAPNHQIRFRYVMVSLFCLLAGSILVVYLIPQLYMVIPVPVYLTFHTILEFFSVVVSAAVFIVAWYNFQQTRNRRELIICLTFLAVGIIDFAHALSYKGMPEFFSANSVNKASTYWITGRLIQAAGILAATLVNPGLTRKQVNPLGYVFFTVTVVSAALVFIAADPNFLPHMYLEGQGQTAAKRVLEYVVIALQTAALIYLFTREKSWAAERHLEAALLLSIFSEIAFTLYSSAYDTYNLIGHIYKIGAFVSILRGFFIASVVRLYEANKVLDEKHKKLAEVNAELEKVNRLETDFLANTNHELRTPLTAIVAFTELLLDSETGPLNEIQKDYLLEVNDSSQKLLVEINNLLDLSKMEAGQMKLYIETAPLQEVISQVLRQLDPIFRQKDQQVTTRFPDHLADIPMDREKVKKIMINLLSNAHKFSPASGSILVEAVPSEDGNATTVNVTDNGVGLSKDQIASIFDKFYQIEGSLTREHHGTGLGLPLVSYFVKLHGGKVWVVSEPGHGSTFSFSLPLKLPTQEVV